MTRFSCKTEEISTDVLILPGFHEGLSRRGSWFACTSKPENFIKQFHKRKKYILRYEIHEPDSLTPLSDGEIFHLANTITFSYDQYKSQLMRMEMQYRDIRKRGKLNALIYLLGILTVRWYWWIFLTRGEMSLNNHQNAGKLRKMVKTENILTRFWKRGESPQLKQALNETVRKYRSLSGSCLEKYDALIDWTNEKASENSEFQKICEGYKEIKSKFTGPSLYTKMLPTTLIQRVKFFFFRSFALPMPDSFLPVRNLDEKMKESPVSSIKRETCPWQENEVNGNIIELFLLASKEGDPVCVPDKEPLQLAGTLTRAGNMRKSDLELKIVLHVGSDLERESLLTGENRQNVQKRVLNAALDTIRQGETILGYYMKELLPVLFKRMRAMYPFRSRLHSLFPWLFITNGIPVASILAAVWLFIDPYYQGKFMRNYSRYYDRILETLDLSYHNISVSIKTDNALGQVNRMIRENRDDRGFRDVIGKINQFALPVSIMDRAVFNNLTMETKQLADSMREANSFTTIPLSFFSEEALRG